MQSEINENDICEGIAIVHYHCIGNGAGVKIFYPGEQVNFDVIREENYKYEIEILKIIPIFLDGPGVDLINALKTLGCEGHLHSLLNDIVGTLL